MSVENRRRSPEELREMLKDLQFLPSRRDILRAFGEDTDAWNRFCVNRDKNGQRLFFELLNTEFIDGLSGYLQTIGERFGVTDRPLTVLEVGAGNGRLAHFLKERLDKNKVSYIATDPGFWGYDNIFPSDSVEKLDYEHALKAYKPDVVIASWMVYRADWTQDFRDTDSVQEYLLIGEPRVTGDDWLTWGGVYFGEEGKKPQYESDGFEKVLLKELSKSQICANDSLPRLNIHSSTYSFRRTEA